MGWKVDHVKTKQSAQITEPDRITDETLREEGLEKSCPEKKADEGRNKERLTKPPCRRYTFKGYMTEDVRTTA